jgi:Helicase associated domain
MSALPPKADVAKCQRDVRFVPKADIPLVALTLQPTVSSRRPDSLRFLKDGDPKPGVNSVKQNLRVYPLSQRAEDIGWKILKVRRYYNGMRRNLINTHKDRWERGFAALSKFRRRKRHCCPSRHHLEGKFKVGQWVTTQRYLKDDLSLERKRCLDRIGFVWNWRNYRWEQGFAALSKLSTARDTVAYRSNTAKEISDLDIGSLRNAEKRPSYQLCESADLIRSALCGGKVGVSTNKAFAAEIKRRALAPRILFGVTANEVIE